MIRFAVLCFASLLFLASPASAQNFDVSEVQIKIEAQDAVKARDEAIVMAQRQALAQLVGKPVEVLKDVTDDQIARLVSNFSVRNERLALKSYSATYTIRFDPNRTQSFIQDHHFDLVDQAPSTETPEQAAAVGMPKNIVVFPVLDIGARQVVWDESNPWRDVWQQNDHSIKGMTIRVPVGDITDIADVPDAGFLQGKPANIANMLSRYDAHDLYVVVAKNQGAALDTSKGMALSIYRHDGTQLKFVRKLMLHPRPGYAFEDAVPAAVHLIVMAENNLSDDETIQTADETDADVPPTETIETTTTTVTTTTAPTEQSPILDYPAAATSQSLVVTVPYQSLQQWVNIQQRLRRVTGVSDVVPVRVSPSSAQVELMSNVPPAQLVENLKVAAFSLQILPTGENALIEQ